MSIPTQLPASIQYTRVYGQLVYAEADTVGDADEYPDAMPASGRITFRPSLDRIFPFEQVIVVPKTLTAELDSQGRFSIWLISSQIPNVSPSSWTYSITVAVDGVLPWTWDAVLPPGQRNLRDLVQVPASSGVFITKGDPGAGVASAELVEGELVLTLTDGQTLPPVPLPVGGGGVTSHGALSGRSAANQHPISAITNLQATLDNMQVEGDYVRTVNGFQSDPQGNVIVGGPPDSSGFNQFVVIRAGTGQIPVGTPEGTLVVQVPSQTNFVRMTQLYVQRGSAQLPANLPVGTVVVRTP